MWAGALYPGLGEQRRRPCLRLQQAGVTAFHPASGDAGYVSVALSMRPSRQERSLPMVGQRQDEGRKPTAEVARALCVPRTTVARRRERRVREKIATIGVF